MEESTVYQWILEEGIARGRAAAEAEFRLDEAKLILQRISSKRLGSPPVHIIEQLQALSDVRKVELLVCRAIEATNWRDLFAE